MLGKCVVAFRRDLVGGADLPLRRLQSTTCSSCPSAALLPQHCASVAASSAPDHSLTLRLAPRAQVDTCLVVFLVALFRPPLFASCSRENLFYVPVTAYRGSP